MKTTLHHLDSEVGNAMAKTFDAWRAGARLRPRGRAMLRGLALATLLLSACDSGAGAASSAREPASQASTANVERLGLMRTEAADVSADAGWHAWFSAPWSAGEGSPGAFETVRSVCSAGDCSVAERRDVDSCAALFDADAKGLDVEGMEEPQAAYLQRRLVCYAGRSLQAMRDAETSHVADYALDASTLAELPAELGYPVAPEQFAQARRIDAESGGLGEFLQQLPGAPDSGTAKASDKGLRLDDAEGWTREWLLLGRGDLDGDGLEDLLVGVNLYITEEALRFGSALFAVTRDRPGGPMRVVYEIPILGAPGACSDNTRCADFLLPDGTP